MSKRSLIPAISFLILAIALVFVFSAEHAIAYVTATPTVAPTETPAVEPTVTPTAEITSEPTPTVQPTCGPFNVYLNRYEASACTLKTVAQCVKLGILTNGQGNIEIMSYDSAVLGYRLYPVMMGVVRDPIEIPEKDFTFNNVAGAAYQLNDQPYQDPSFNTPVNYFALTNDIWADNPMANENTLFAVFETTPNALPSAMIPGFSYTDGVIDISFNEANLQDGKIEFKVWIRWTGGAMETGYVTLHQEPYKAPIFGGQYNVNLPAVEGIDWNENTGSIFGVPISEGHLEFVIEARSGEYWDRKAIHIGK